MINHAPTSVSLHNKLASTFVLFVTLLAWYGVITQLYILLAHPESGRTIPGIIVQFISYFTIICNTLISISLTAIWFSPASAWGKFFSRNTVATAITLYILIVGVVYNTVLRNLVPLNGLGYWVNEILHVAVPILYLLFWLSIVPKAGLKWNSFLPWLWVPFCYLVYVLIRGAICGMYPYPFMNAGKYGYTHVALSSVVIMLAFLVFGLLLIGIAKLMAK